MQKYQIYAESFLQKQMIRVNKMLHVQEIKRFVGQKSYKIFAKEKYIYTLFFILQS